MYIVHMCNSTLFTPHRNAFLSIASIQCSRCAAPLCRSSTGAILHIILAPCGCTAAPMTPNDPLNWNSASWVACRHVAYV